MHITRSSIDTRKGPADWFTGDVYIDAVAAPTGTSTFAAALVHFSPAARTAWHTHPHGQTIFVIEGIGLCQREGGPVEVIRPGDRVFFEPNENHWHGATPNRFMAHIAPSPGASTSALSSTPRAEDPVADSEPVSPSRRGRRFLSAPLIGGAFPAATDRFALGRTLAAPRCGAAKGSRRAG
jgi:quercetin dioxygenase-like cupin family protein